MQRKVQNFEANNRQPHGATSQVLSNPLVELLIHRKTLNKAAKWARAGKKKQKLYSA